MAEDAKLGDSISVNGVCLTIATLEQGVATFQAGAETLRKTTAGSWQPGLAVNLERALALGDRLGGHLVAGHVDGIGRIHERRSEGDSERFTILLPENGSVKVVEKGSVAVDGISLTTWDCRGGRCSMSIIRHTLANTTLGDARPGTAVNLEQDFGSLGAGLHAKKPACIMTRIILSAREKLEQDFGNLAVALMQRVERMAAKFADPDEVIKAVVRFMTAEQRTAIELRSLRHDPIALDCLVRLAGCSRFGLGIAIFDYGQFWSVVQDRQFRHVLGREGMGEDWEHYLPSFPSLEGR